jgi:phosphonopyruvate decarboxylase
VLQTISQETTIVSTTGYTSRQLLQARLALNQSIDKDFLVIGGMGHAISIATGLAITNPQKRVLCIDGDGSFSMHTGSLFRSAKQPNLTHLVINNQSHDSVGGQRTTSADSKLHKIAESFGYKFTSIAEDLQSLNGILEYVNNFEHSAFIEVASRGKNEPDLVRPALSAVQMRDFFMQHQLSSSDNNGSV